MQRVLFALTLFAAAGLTRAAPVLVHVCENLLPYPPLRWVTETARGQRFLHGYSYLLLQRVLAGSEFRFDVSLQPLSRCLREVETGGRFQMLINGSYSEERARHYLLSDAWRTTHFHAFYSREKFPHTPPLRSAVELEKFSLCGIQGANFSMFKLPPERYDMGASDLVVALEKVRRGRCDILPFNLEVSEGIARLQPEVMQGIAHVALEDVPDGYFTMLISRQWPQGPALQQQINQGLHRMRANGELEKFWSDAAPAQWRAQLLQRAGGEKTAVLSAQ